MLFFKSYDILQRLYRISIKLAMNTNFEQSPEWLLSNIKGKHSYLRVSEGNYKQVLYNKFYYVFNQFIIKQYSL